VLVRSAKSVGREQRLGLLAAGMVTVFAGFVTACSSPPPEPRGFFVFMEDALAREGVLARCNQDRDSTLRDVECSNARRAAAAIAIELERDRSIALAHESERKLLALRARSARAADANAAAGGPVASFGAPVGPVLPSMSETSLFDVYAEPTGQPLNRPEFEIAAIEPPMSEVPIAHPALELEEFATIPRPFRSDEERAIPQ
jgi:hypothetical protein